MDIRQKYTEEEMGRLSAIEEIMDVEDKQIFAPPFDFAFAVYSIVFINQDGYEDETEFDIQSADELKELFNEFRKENEIPVKSVVCIKFEGYFIPADF